MLSNVLRRPEIATPKLGLWLMPPALVGCGLWLLWKDNYTYVAALLLALPFLILAFIDIKALLYTTFAFLFLLGDIRRIVGGVLGYPAKDPLLLIGPLVTVLIVLPLLLQVRLKDNISKAVLAVTVLMVLEIFNPRQGGLNVGLTGAFYELVPFLWFWIGREYGTDRMLRNLLYRVILPLGLLAALFGFIQTYIGFFPWQRAWIQAVSSVYHSLSVGGFTRAFGFSVNGIEYVDLLLVSSALVLGAAFSGRRVFLLLLLPLAVMLFLSSARTPIFRLLATGAYVWALSAKGGKRWRSRLLLALVVGFGAMVGLVRHASGGGDQGGGGGVQHYKSAVDAASAHQLQGLAHPLDTKRSTAVGHVHYFWIGIMNGFRYPIGSGLGVLRVGAAPGGASGEDPTAAASLNATEYDISDVFVMLGCVGGLLYVYIIFQVVRRSVSYARTTPPDVGLPLIGILLSMVATWLAFGQYAIAPLMWFLVGAFSRERPKAMLRAGTSAAITHAAGGIRPRAANKSVKTPAASQSVSLSRG